MWQTGSVLISFISHNNSIKSCLLPSNKLLDELEHSPIEHYCGWGKCNRDWCNCKAFEGNDDLCRNCGHAYAEHYGY